MAADKHRIPGDSDKHLSDWRFDDAEGGSFTTEEQTINSHQIFVQSTQPSSPEAGDVWLDIS